MKIVRTAIIDNAEIGYTISKLSEYTKSDFIQSYTEDNTHLIIYATFEETLDEIIADFRRELDGELETEWFNINDDFSFDELLALKEEFVQLRAENMNSMEYINKIAK